MIAVFRVGKTTLQNNVELGRHRRNRCNVWSYPGVNSFGADRDDALAMHPTAKPVALVADAMRDCTTKGDLVLDPFLGSGTTIMAAEKIGRRCLGLNASPHSSMSRSDAGKLTQATKPFWKATAELSMRSPPSAR